MKNQLAKIERQQPVAIPIIKITVDSRLQIREKMLPWKVEEYRNKYINGIEMKPLIVGERGEGYVLIAGFHRLAAMRKAGMRHAEAIITNVPQSRWAWLAIESNLAHGIPLKSSEIRKAFRVLINSKENVLRDGRLMSYDELAKKLGGSKTRMTIFNWMKEDFPEIAECMSAEGLKLRKKGFEEEDDMMRDDRIISEMTQLIEKAVALSRTIITEDGRERFNDEVSRVLHEVDEADVECIDDENPDF